MARILALEDDSALAELLAFHLGTAGHEVRIAPNVREALATLPLFAPDIVLLDILLPDAVGLSVCETIRQTAATAHVPVIFVSACQDHEVHELALRAGADDFITSPFAADDLVARIEAQLVIASHFRHRGAPLHAAVGA